jgi:hypothetical protein
MAAGHMVALFGLVLRTFHILAEKGPRFEVIVQLSWRPLYVPEADSNRRGLSGFGNFYLRL